MKQKVLIKISMEGHKSRTKALKIVVGVSGVESAALKGDQIEVTGDGMDPVVLMSLLRKKVGYAELLSVGPAGGGEKKEEPKKQDEVKIQPIQFWPVYHGGVPHNDFPVVSVDRPYDPCSIM